MSQIFIDAPQNLTDALGKMPGVGLKSVQRIAFRVPQTDPENIKSLAVTLQTAKNMIRFCEICGSVTENPVCQICVDPRHDHSLICVVEGAKDIASLEKTRSHWGPYHVLGGATDPINSTGPDQLRIKSLMERLRDAEVKEVIIATNSNAEGEATTTYLSRLPTTLQTPVSRLASGLPVGSDSEYTDEMTPSRAPEGRYSSG